MGRRLLPKGFLRHSAHVMGAMMKRVLGLAFVGFIIWAVYYAPERVVDNPAPSASVPATAASIPKKPGSVDNAYNVCTG
jgi:hypothetical protein